MRSLMENVDRVIDKVTRILNFIGCGMLMFIILLTVADVVGRYMRHPIPGAMELAQLSFAAVITMCLAWTTRIGGHVSINFLTSRLPPRVEQVIAVMGLFLAIGVWVLIGWQSFVMPFLLKDEVTPVINMPLLPFRLLLPFGVFFVCFVLVIQIVNDIKKLGGK